MCSSSRRSTGRNAQLSSHGSTRLATTYSSASARGTRPSGSWFAMQPISRISISLQSDICDLLSEPDGSSVYANFST
jgi:hypothetical protein